MSATSNFVDNRFIGFPVIDAYLSSGTGSTIPLSITNSGGGAGPTIKQSEPGHNSVWGVKTGTSSANGTSYVKGTSGISGVYLDDGITILRLPLKIYPGGSISATDYFKFHVGFALNTNTNILPTSGIYFYADYALYGDSYLRARVAGTGGSFEKNTGILLDVNNYWRVFGITVNGNMGSSKNYIEFFCTTENGSTLTNNPASVCTISQVEVENAGITMPNGLNDIMVPSFGIVRPLTIFTEKQLYYDSIYLDKQYN